MSGDEAKEMADPVIGKNEKAHIGMRQGIDSVRRGEQPSPGSNIKPAMNSASYSKYM